MNSVFLVKNSGSQYLFLEVGIQDWTVMAHCATRFFTRKQAEFYSKSTGGEIIEVSLESLVGVAKA